MRPSLIAWIVNSAPSMRSSISTDSPAPPRAQQLERVLARRLVVGQVRAHHLHALAAGQAGGLDRDGGRAELRHRARTSASSRTTCRRGHRLGRDVRRAACARTPCSTRSPSPSRVGPTTRVPCDEQRVDDPRRERLVGADHRDVDLALARERRRPAPGRRRRRRRRPPPDSAQRREDRRVLVPDDRMQLGVLGHPRGERALAPPVADDQRSHARQSRGGQRRQSAARSKRRTSRPHSGLGAPARGRLLCTPG